MTAVGFTGTRRGMTPAQRDRVEELLWFGHSDPVEFHHGNCKGADAQAAIIAATAGYRVVAHPSNLDEWDAGLFTSHEYLPERNPLDRNRDIVDASALMLAAPSGTVEQHRGSGTWATIRYARKTGVRLVVVYPDGTKEET